MPNENIPRDIVSAIQVTSSSDLKEKIYYYRIMWNRQIKKINLIDFYSIKEQIINDDEKKKM